MAAGSCGVLACMNVETLSHPPPRRRPVGSPGLQIPLFAPLDALVRCGRAGSLSQLGQSSMDSGIDAASSFDPATRFPAKIVVKIEALEFVEISELLQESWSVDGADPI